jgi:hypothetical protein
MSTRALNALLAALFLGSFGVMWASRRDVHQPNWEIFPDMTHAPRANAFSENAVFPNGKTLQAPPAGTIPRGWLPLHYAATAAGRTALGPTALDFERTRQEARRRLAALGVAGVALLAAGMLAGAERAWSAWLVASLGLLDLGLFGVVFVATQYASGAAWSVALRRIPEAMASAIVLGGVGVGVVLLARPELYPWTRGLGDHAGPLAAFKVWWLSWPFAVARAAIYLAVWLGFARAIVAHSRRQDEDGEPAHTRQNIRLSVGFLVAFAATFSLASFDWVMSLEPDWYSTIFAVYRFAGLFSSGLAALIVAAIVLGRGPLRFVVSGEHLHDLGKLLFAFCTFWMYIWFSQYMLIWYANFPEETTYFVLRTRGAWALLFFTNVLLNWIVPFLVLLRRSPKRRPELLVKVAAVVLAGHWLDLHLMIVPAASPHPPGALPAAGDVFAWWDAAGAAALVGAAGWAVARGLARAPLVPVNDPQLAASLHHHS